MNIDYTTVYKHNIENIKKQEIRAILDKKWTELAKLRVKRADFEAKIKEIEEGNL